MNKYAQNIDRQLKYSVDDNTGRLIVSVLDSETKELIRQIPLEQVITIAWSLRTAGKNRVGPFDAGILR